MATHRVVKVQWQKTSPKRLDIFTLIQVRCIVL